MTELKTGDLIFFTGHTKGWLSSFSTLIEYTTHSNFSHIAVILKDPTFISPILKGTYVWQSSWEGKPDPQDGKIKLGVQITPLKEVLETFKNSKVIVRTISCPEDTFSNEKLNEIHKVVYDKPYDIVPKDWIEALLRKDDKPQKTNRFWCSALVGYIYTKCGILRADTDWSIMRPNDFSLDGEFLNLNEGFVLSNTETRIQ
tara:strand:+ start:1820 stop:2422 length:603 start_codon:yes stop_codon:yes gene_type:complete